MKLPRDYYFYVRSSKDGLIYFLNLFQFMHHNRTGEIPANAICETSLTEI